MMQNDLITDLRAAIRRLADTLESQRKTFIIWLLIGIGLASFIMTFLLLYINPQGIDIRYTVTFGALVPSAITYLFLSQAYMKEAKERYIEALCKATGFKYRENGCFSIGTAHKHRILPEHNKSKMETGLQGTYQNVPIAVQETILTALKQDPKHKKRKKEFLRFWGLLVRIQLSRSVEGHTVAIPRTTMLTFFRNDFSQYETVKMADGKFAHMFDVKATDKVEAKFVLNAGFRDSFVAASRKLNVYWSEASFKDNEVLLAFQRFRPLIKVDPLWKPVTEKNLRRNSEELESLIRIIEALKANPQISV